MDGRYNKLKRKSDEPHKRLSWILEAKAARKLLQKEQEKAKQQAPQEVLDAPDFVGAFGRAATGERAEEGGSTCQGPGDGNLE